MPTPRTVTETLKTLLEIMIDILAQNSFINQRTSLGKIMIWLVLTEFIHKLVSLFTRYEY